MATSCRAAFLQAVFFGFIPHDVVGGMSQSFRGAKIHNAMVHSLDERLSEADLPDIDEIDENAAVFHGPGAGSRQIGGDDSAEIADSDENDDVAEEDDGGIGSDEGDNTDESSDTIDHLTRVSRIVDSNSDGVMSSQELVEFANSLRSKQRWEHARSAMDALDANGDGHVARAEIADRVSTPARSDDKKRFAAADWNGDGLLNETEFHAFAYPASHDTVLKVETMHHFEIFDKDGNQRISLEEFIKDNQHHEDFSHEAAREDFYLHDIDSSGDLDADEFERLLSGHDLLLDSVVKAISAVDSDGDGHISITEEVPNGIQGLLDSEYIEDFFYHESVSRHQEL
eukprot:gnl/MRDRNA2_/MRDRNA2_89048_c0_seq1.p1 gnl/MRDRNA2_/MRDRNA2_89048_c0~~gnl/MRDRNA2_/MRDRNA2_89048_c0_seq1.p1  ORF type:complete len:342 (-),score=95.76 gnl/MRDRNA2_/MRDRNA2_89048_c0_seq1:51-1076(-)